MSGVGVRLVQTGGVRAEGAVDEEVTGGADRAQLARLVDVLFGPVADHARAGLRGRQPQQPGEVVLGGDVRACAFVNGSDAEGGGVREGGALGLGALGGGEGPEGGGAHGVVGVGGERAVRAGDVAGDEVEQGGGDDGRVDVDAAEVEGAPTGGLVQLGAGRGLPVGPPGGVPAVAEEHPVRRAGRGEVADEGEGGLAGGGAGKVQPGEGEAGGRRVHVCVGERRGDQGAVQVDHLVHAVGEGVRGALGADPGDLAAFDDHRRREGVGGTVHLAAAQQDGGGRGGRGGGLTHGHQSRPSRGAPGTQVTPVRVTGGPYGHGPVAPVLRPGAAWPRTAWRARRWSGSRRRPGSAPGRGVPPARAGSTPAP